MGQGPTPCLHSAGDALRLTSSAPGPRRDPALNLEGARSGLSSIARFANAGRGPQAFGLLRSCAVTRFSWAVGLTLLALSIAPRLALSQSATAPAPANLQVLEISIENGRARLAQNTLRVRQHDAVELRWRSDRAIELHLHGYDIHAAVGPQAPATMRFSARLAGRFAVAEHRKAAHSHRAIVYLEVHP